MTGIFDYPQFINWRLVQKEPAPKKPAKIPWDYATNREIDPHNPANWKTYQAALSTNQSVGFVLSMRDPFFYLDLDECRNGSGWTAEAAQVCNYFPSAAREISQSGNGIHIVGHCNKLMMVDRKHKFRFGSLAVEFYTDKRFMALGPWGFEGNFALDWTQHLAAWIPRKEPADDLQSGPSADYTGPADDDELIAKAMSSRGSIGQMFGAKASFEQLWMARADVLAQHFPSPSGDVWDRSSADAALMAHLAFWTGKDAARMDRLFRRSGLIRDKYRDRADYREMTIRNAVANCKKVYDLVKPVDQIGTQQFGPFLTIAEQQEYFKGCTYVLDIHRIVTPHGPMKTEQFNAYYGGKVFVVSNQDDVTRKAWEAFCENRAYQFPKVRSTCFRPKATPGTIIDGKVNIYVPYQPERVKGDPSPFLNHLARMLPVQRDRDILISYMASLAQNPGVKFQWAPAIQGIEGNGKTIITLCLEHTVGLNYSHRPAAEDLANPFNSYLENKLFIAVEEVHLEGKRQLLDILKPLITNDRVEIQPKGVDKRMIDNWANWIFLTNHRDAILKGANDRRYAIFFTAQQFAEDIIRDGMGGDYFPKLYAWLRADGFKIVTDYLLSYRIPVELDPAVTLQRAPETSTTPQALKVSLGKAEQEIIEAVEQELDGFKGGWISTYCVEVLLKENHIHISRYRMGEMLNAMGYQLVERSRRPLMSEDMKRPQLYIRRQQYDATLGTEHYCIAQGYREHFKPSNVIPLHQKNI